MGNENLELLILSASHFFATEETKLMNYDPVVIAWDLKNHIKSVHTSSTHFID